MQLLSRNVRYYPYFILSVFLALSDFNYAFGQAPAIQWQKALGGSHDERGGVALQTFDGGYVICGSTTSIDCDITGRIDTLSNDFWVAKFTSNGVLVWQKSLGGSSFDQSFYMIQAKDSGYLIVGETMSNDGDVTNNNGGEDGWVIKLGPTGNIQWQKTYGGLLNDQVHSAKQTADRGYILVGSKMDNNNSGDFWALKLDSVGNINWQKTYGGSHWDAVSDVVETQDLDYILAGRTFSNDGDVTSYHGGGDAWAIKINSSGNLLWQRTYGGSHWDGINSLHYSKAAGLMAAGSSWSTDGDINHNHGWYDVWVLSLNPGNGDVIWQKTYGGTGSDQALMINTTSDGGYVLAASTNSDDGDITDNLGNGDFWIFKITSNGTMLWQKSYGGTQDDLPYSIQQTSDDGYILAGETNSNDIDISGNHGSRDLWLVKLGPDSTSVLRASMSTTSTIVKVYPTLTSGLLNIDLPGNFESAFAELFSILGTEIKTQKNLKPGDNKIFINNLPSGIYILQIKIDTAVYYFKIMYQP